MCQSCAEGTLVKLPEESTEARINSINKELIIYLYLSEVNFPNFYQNINFLYMLISKPYMQISTTNLAISSTNT